MLKILRAGNPHTRAIWWILIVVTVVTFLGGFVFIFGAGLDSTQQARSVGALAVVDGERITQTQYAEALAMQRDAYRQQFGTEPSGRDEQLIQVQAWRGLVDQAIMRSVARRQGLGVSDPEVVLTLKTSPPQQLAGIEAFKTNGQFDPQKYAQALRDPSLNWSVFEDLVRQQLPVRKLQERWVTAVKVSEPELRQSYQDRFERVALSWVRIAGVAVPNLPPPSDSVLRQVYERHKGDFSLPAASRLEVVAMPKPVSQADLASVREQAAAIVKRARAGESFADLARTYSVGPYAERGGALERPVTVNELGPALAPTLPRLKPGDIVDALEEGAMFYVFRLDSVITSGPAPGYRLSQILLRARHDDAELEKLNQTLAKVRARARKVGVGAAAAEQGLATQQTPFFDWNNGPPQLYALPEAAEWGLTAPLKAVSGVFSNDDAMAVVQVIERRQAGPRSFEEVKEQVRALAEQEARVEVARAAAQQFAALLGSGKTLQQAAAGANLSVDHSEGFTRVQPDPRLMGVPEVVGAAFSVKAGGVAGPLRARDGWYFLQVDNRIPPDEKAYESLRGQVMSQVLQAKRAAAFQSWVSTLRAGAKVQDLRGDQVAS